MSRAAAKVRVVVRRGSAGHFLFLTVSCAARCRTKQRCRSHGWRPVWIPLRLFLAQHGASLPMRTKRTLLTTLLAVAAGIGYGGQGWAQSPEGSAQPSPSYSDQAQYPTAENADARSPEDLRIRAAVEQVLKEKEDA